LNLVSIKGTIDVELSDNTQTESGVSASAAWTGFQDDNKCNNWVSSASSDKANFRQLIISRNHPAILYRIFYTEFMNPSSMASCNVKANLVCATGD
jgi:hypothetical protein